MCPRWGHSRCTWPRTPYSQQVIWHLLPRIDHPESAPVSSLRSLAISLVRRRTCQARSSTVFQETGLCSVKHDCNNIPSFISAMSTARVSHACFSRWSLFWADSTISSWQARVSASVSVLGISRMSCSWVVADQILKLVPCQFLSLLSLLSRSLRVGFFCQDTQRFSKLRQLLVHPLASTLHRYCHSSLFPSRANCCCRQLLAVRYSWDSLTPNCWAVLKGSSSSSDSRSFVSFSARMSASVAYSSERVIHTVKSTPAANLSGGRAHICSVSHVAIPLLTPVWCRMALYSLFQ